MARIVRTREENEETPVFGSDLSQTADREDPGDETQRNFRYQHAYGVILLIAGASELKPYSAVWCEHHEDLLAERLDGSYDAFQIKTRRPEIGDWTLTDEAFKRSIKRFSELNLRFAGRIREFSFVSNTDYLTCALDIKNKKKLQRSPRRFLEAVRSAGSVSAVRSPFKDALKDLALFCECEVETLFQTLKVTNLIKGPARDSFGTDVAHDHLPKMEACKRLPPATLNAIRDELMQKVFAASSLQVEDPRRHIHPLDDDPGPEVIAKKVDVAVVTECIQQSREIPFRFQGGSASLDLGNRTGTLSVMKEKLVRGGLANHIQSMERRTLSTEYRLLELLHTFPERFEETLNQMESVVEGECAEAALEAQLTAEHYGPSMLADVHRRLRHIANDKAEMVYHEPYESLMGVVGLLTEKCTVWWSTRFNLGEPA